MARSDSRVPALRLYNPILWKPCTSSPRKAACAAPHLPSWCLRHSTPLPSLTCQTVPPSPPSLLAFLALGEQRAGWGSPAQPIPEKRAGVWERRKRSSPERHPSLSVGACVGAATSTITRLSGAVGVCGCPWEPTLARAAVSAHRCLCLPGHAPVYVWAAVATQAPSIPLLGSRGVGPGH